MEHPEQHGQAEDGTLAAVPGGPALADSDFVTGTVSEWHHEEGWGVVEAPEVPGGCWTHFTAIADPGDPQLTVGELVRFAAEPAEQDGFAYRAIAVLRAGMTTADIPDPTLEPSASPAYSSTLTISFDDGRLITLDGRDDAGIRALLRRADAGDS